MHIENVYKVFVYFRSTTGKEGYEPNTEVD